MIPQRPHGVHVPTNQRTEQEQAEPNRILDVIPAEYFAVRYSDGAGRVHKTFWIVAGGVVYEPPNSEAWAQGLRVVNEEFSRQLLGKISKEKIQADAIPDRGIDVLVER
jgi:hypothetical protein